MTIALIVAITNTLAALVAYVTNHTITFGFHVAMVIIFTLSAISCEVKMLSRIKKLEEENEILKRRL